MCVRIYRTVESSRDYWIAGANQRESEDPRRILPLDRSITKTLAVYLNGVSAVRSLSVTEARRENELMSHDVALRVVGRVTSLISSGKFESRKRNEGARMEKIRLPTVDVFTG